MTIRGNMLAVDRALDQARTHAAATTSSGEPAPRATRQRPHAPQREPLLARGEPSERRQQLVALDVVCPEGAGQPLFSFLGQAEDGNARVDV